MVLIIDIMSLLLMLLGTDNVIHNEFTIKPRVHAEIHEKLRVCENLADLTSVLLDASEDWDVIESAADVSEKTTVGFGETATSKKTLTFMGWRDVRNKMRGEAQANKVWLYVRIASDPPAQPPGGRRGATNPSQGGGGRLSQHRAGFKQRQCTAVDGKCCAGVTRRTETANCVPYGCKNGGDFVVV